MVRNFGKMLQRKRYQWREEEFVAAQEESSMTLVGNGSEISRQQVGGAEQVLPVVLAQGSRTEFFDSERFLCFSAVSLFWLGVELQTSFCKGYLCLKISVLFNVRLFSMLMQSGFFCRRPFLWVVVLMKGLC